MPIANPVNSESQVNFLPGPKLVPARIFPTCVIAMRRALPDPEQVVAWDGSGGVRDSFDYSVSSASVSRCAQDIEVDGHCRRRRCAVPGIVQRQPSRRCCFPSNHRSGQRSCLIRATGLPASPVRVRRVGHEHGYRRHEPAAGSRTAWKFGAAIITTTAIATRWRAIHSSRISSSRMNRER